MGEEGPTPPQPQPPYAAEGGERNADAIFSDGGDGDGDDDDSRRRWLWLGDPNLSRAVFAICEGARCDVVAACDDRADVAGE